MEEELDKIISWAISKRQTVIITWNLNLDRLKPREREGKLLIDVEEVLELKCLIDIFTRVTLTSSTLLDVILTSKPGLFESTGVAEMGFSDHELIYGFFNKAVKQHTTNIVNCRSRRHLVLKKFQKDLKDIGGFENPSAPVNEQYTHWKTEFTKIIDKHLPVKKDESKNEQCPLYECGMEGSNT